MTEMPIRHIAAQAVFLTLLFGCDGPVAPTPPAPPERTNVHLPDYTPHCGNTAGRGDTIVVGQCITSRIYATTRQGDWQDHWHLVRVWMIAVETGKWDKPMGEDPNADPGHTPMPYGLVFIARDRWPTSESGIMIDKGRWTYRPGLVYAFDIDTTQNPPVIVGQEQRSLVDPSKASTLGSPSSSEASSERLRRTHAAIKSYVESTGRSMAGQVVEFIEETGSDYIGILRSGEEYKVLKVDKTTFSVAPAKT